MIRRLSVPLFVIALLISTGAPVAASGYDGTDPHNTGCDTYASTLDYIFIDQGTTQLRWSSTCSTAWARFICSKQGGCTNYNIMVFRTTDGRSYTNGVTWPYYTPVNGTLYTLQLDDGAGQHAKACYQAAFDNYQWHCTGAYAPAP